MFIEEYSNRTVLHTEFYGTEFRTAAVQLRAVRRSVLVRLKPSTTTLLGTACRIIVLALIRYTLWYGCHRVVGQLRTGIVVQPFYHVFPEIGSRGPHPHAASSDLISPA